MLIEILVAASALGLAGAGLYLRTRTAPSAPAAPSSAQPVLDRCPFVTTESRYNNVTTKRCALQMGHADNHDYRSA